MGGCSPGLTAPYVGCPWMMASDFITRERTWFLRNTAACQARMDMEAQKAAGDTQLGQLQASVRTYSPFTPIRAPQPVGEVASPTLVSAPEQNGLANSLAIGVAGISGTAQGLNLANFITGQTTRQTIGSIGSALGIK